MKNELGKLTQQIDKLLNGPRNPAQLLHLLRKRSALIRSNPPADADLLKEVLKKNRQWMSRFAQIKQEIEFDIASEKKSKQRKASIVSAYKGSPNPNKIFSGRG